MATTDVLVLGREAQRLLDDEYLNAAFASLEAHYIDVWKNSADPTTREKCHSLIQAIEGVRTELRKMVGDKTMKDAQDARFGRNQKK